MKLLVFLPVLCNLLDNMRRVVRLEFGASQPHSVKLYVDGRGNLSAHEVPTNERTTGAAAGRSNTDRRPALRPPWHGRYLVFPALRRLRDARRDGAAAVGDWRCRSSRS